MTKECLVFLIIAFFQSKILLARCSGRIFNPVTDVCWSCIFPISIGGVRMGQSVADPSNSSTIPCVCPGKVLGLPQIGIPIGFWEGIEIYDMSKDPFCLVSLGGLNLKVGGFAGRGSQSDKGRRTRYAAWHMHKYTMPIFKLLSIVFDTTCLEVSSMTRPFDLGYMTELDPMWLDDELTFILNPEAVVFGKPAAQAACTADCTAATAHLPLDNLFWCGGCQGSMYPLTGNIAGDYGGIQSSLLSMEKFIYKMHRELQMWETSGSGALCQAKPRPFIKKSQYRTQLIYPSVMNSKKEGCQPMGRANVLYDSGKEIPIKGENFGYLLWRKRNCCAF